MTLCIVGISGNTGSGKSTLVLELAKRLNATTIAWDDFDPISTAPDDYVDWYNRGGDYNEWNYAALAQVISQLKAGRMIIHPVLKTELLPTEIIIFDAPLGRLHKQTGNYIDVWIHITVPLDILLCRRLLRDFKSADKTKEELLEELEFYLKSSRPLYFDKIQREKADVVLDGMLPIETQVSKIINTIKNRLYK